MLSTYFDYSGHSVWRLVAVVVGGTKLTIVATVDVWSTTAS